MVGKHNNENLELEDQPDINKPYTSNVKEHNKYKNILFIIIKFLQNG